MVVSRADLEELVRELPDSELTAAYEALERLTQGGREVARERRREKLRAAGLLARAATGTLSRELAGYDPPVITGETLAETVIKNRE